MKDQTWYDDSDDLDPEADGPLAAGGDRRRLSRAHLSEDVGAATAEYAITILAACGFAALLVALLRSGEAREALWTIVESALALAG
jgi:hypothetical protein